MRLKHFSLAYGSQFFKAMSDESRLRILHLVHKNKEMCISDLEQVLDFTQTKTSRHVIYLKNTGLLAYRKVDQWAYYYIKDEAIDFVSQVLGYFEKDPLLAKDLDVYKVLYSNRELAANQLHSRKYSSKSYEL